MIRIAWIICIVLSGLSTAQATIYSWTDNRGVVHFSDQPGPPGAKEVQLAPTQIAEPLPASSIPPPATEATASTAEVSKAEEKKVSYESVTIMEPKDNDTIRNPQGYIPVTVEVTPQLQEEDKLQLMLDGNVMGPPQATRSFSLNGIERGEHTIQVQVVDPKGNELKTSEKITIFMMPPRVNMGTPVKASN